ncbi:MAG: hypothetical protein MH472_11625 [Bacteroidia bacterium]|nr:hypothetical protein [Bacteroidia bacterium]
MNKKRIKELQRLIIEFERPYPNNDLILSYSDFLLKRDYLIYYQFNPKVFYFLVKLADDTWDTGKRISRLSLLQNIKQYYKSAKQNNNKGPKNIDIKPKLSLQTRILLFSLFKKTFEQKLHIVPKQLEEARIICNYTLIDIELTSIEENWLCSNFHISNIILNRVLRYPKKSELISNWAKTNFHKDNLRTRRAELISWLIDQDSKFVVNQQTLVDDFEYLNKSDLQAIQDYDNEIDANKVIEMEFAEYLPKKIEFNFFDGEYDEEVIDLTVPELNLSRRHYGTPKDNTKEYPISIPDFDKMRDYFYANLHTHQKVTMIWAIAYSRINNKKKYALLKRYYCNETYKSLFKVSKRIRNIELLKWLLKQQ